MTKLTRDVDNDTSVRKESTDLVRFDGADDPERPLNWSLKKKIFTTMMYGFTAMGSAVATSM